MRALLALLALAMLALPLRAQEAPIHALLAEHRALIEESSRRTIAPAIDALASSGLPAARAVLEAWQDRRLWLRSADGRFFIAAESGDALDLTEISSGAPAGPAPKADFTQLRPNAGIRAMIGSALVQFQLSDPDPAMRRASLDAIARDPDPSHLPALRAAIANEPDPALKAAKTRLESLLTIRFGDDIAERIAAIDSFGGDLGLDLRATLNPLVATDRLAIAGEPDPAANVARTLTPGEDISRAEAWDLLVAAGLAQPRLTPAAQREALLANLADGAVAGIPADRLGDPAMRDRAHAALARQGLVPPVLTDAEADAILANHRFLEVYREASPDLTAAAERALGAIEFTLAANQTVDLALDALSLASIYFLAAIGLAITFGVMGVINMAHGEFIMMGAYTGYVVQLFVPDLTLSLVLALPLAFAVTFGAGVAMERLVIRWLYNRPLETLLATFGISIALQQLAKTVFGTQARPLTAPDWLDGALVVNDVVGISYIRIAIFGLALIFLVLFLWIMKRTRLGLEVRAVTQNPRMAGSMGINPDRINMLTFGLGSGIAGIAGVAIGLYAKVTSEMGQDYIVQSFMTVVVGGVGNIWGTLLGATLVGFLQKGIEWFNPSNTLAAQTYMILFIILFIQFRPRGIVALRGRAAEA